MELVYKFFSLGPFEAVDKVLNHPDGRLYLVFVHVISLVLPLS